VTGALLTTWDFGDGTTATGDSVYHIYRSEGEFVVRMRSQTKGGCVYLAEGRVRVLAPAGILKVDAGQSCKNQTVRFEVDAVNTDSILYMPGNGVVIRTIDRTVFYRYPNPGRYLPVITLIGPNGCRREIRATDTILVDRMVSGFTLSESRVCGLTEATFRDTARAFSGIRSVTWHIGPYPPQTGRTVKSTFDVSGDYPVKLQVLANSGCIDSVTRTVFIRVNAKPSAGIMADSLGCTGQDVRFAGVVQSADSISYLSWSFPNGFTSTANQVAYRFALAGKYQVRLVAGTAQGCYDTSFHPLTVHPTPVVRASDDLVLCIGQSAQLSAFGANEYTWSPQQGLSCTNCPDPRVTPLTSSNYVVRGTNTFGCSAADTVKVTVIPRMRMTVSGADSLCIGSSTQLLASGGVSWDWSPAAGLSATNIQNPVARPTNTTLYRVVGRDGYNCFTDTGYVLVAIGQPVTVDLGPDLTLPTGTQWPLRSVITNGPIKWWDWKPQTDLSCTVCSLPVATIRKTTTYQVKVTSVYGCVATDTVRINAFCESAQVFIPNAFSPDGDGVNDLLVIRAQGISAIRHFRVFNRWGEIVFERSNFQPNDPSMGWDGRIKGIAGAPEVYVYTADVVCDDGTQYTYKGNITILK
jgi:gliding motility-associated-like protein